MFAEEKPLIRSSIEKSVESTSLNDDDSKTETTNHYELMSAANESS